MKDVTINIEHLTKSLESSVDRGDIRHARREWGVLHWALHWADNGAERSEVWELDAKYRDLMDKAGYLNKPKLIKETA